MQALSIERVFASCPRRYTTFHQSTNEHISGSLWLSVGEYLTNSEVTLLNSFV
jgi:hypothetical protein